MKLDKRQRELLRLLGQACSIGLVDQVWVARVMQSSDRQVAHPTLKMLSIYVQYHHYELFSQSCSKDLRISRHLTSQSEDDCSCHSGMAMISFILCEQSFLFSLPFLTQRITSAATYQLFSCAQTCFYTVVVGLELGSR